MTDKLSYEDARKLRQSGFSNILASKIMYGQDGIGSSVRKSLSVSTHASLMGFKEKFDPLNIARAFTGGSKLAPALLGRMMGRSAEDIDYFTGGKSKSYSKPKTATQKIRSPFYLYTVNRGVQPIRVNDSFATCLNKLYNLIRTHDEKKRLAEEIKHDFEKERIIEEQRQAKKLAVKTKQSIQKQKQKNREEEKGKKKKETPPKTFVDKLKGLFGNVLKSPTTRKIAAGAVGAGVAGYGLSKLLTKGEAASYDTIFGGKEIPLTTMTINEVLQYQTTMKGGSSAVGKYQIMRGTLLDAKKQLNLSGDEKFDENIQDFIYNQFLIGSKRPAVSDYISGRSDDINAAALDLAKEFASFPVTQRVNRPSSKIWSSATIEPGESYYKGVGKNPAKASISIDQVLAGLKEERAIRTGQKNVEDNTQTASAPSTSSSTPPPSPVSQPQQSTPNIQPSKPQPPPVKSAPKQSGQHIAQVSSDNTSNKREKDRKSKIVVAENTNNIIINTEAPRITPPPPQNDSPAWLS